ncbi:hypothetical protein CGI94_13495 [Vibrio parahaemolyticus]|uniref:hypothetical protein n=1 Tax=Vibrio parahaemolyticus TaxID=670 RepID=UPI00111CD199|nr:hypothetical protein [Vibrio parahaemolyticus]TOG77936.1 hypothetical protein CGI94_13495 [Vibrio parahaemolyticus]
MNEKLEKQIQSVLIGIMSDGFNRSINALENAGAINTKKLRAGYKGSGSKYYDVVTAELESTAEQSLPAIKDMIAEINKDSD